MAGSNGAAPVPLVGKRAVDWWFIFKFNAGSFPGCGNSKREPLFGGTIQDYRYWSQQYVYASSGSPNLKKGTGCVGCTTSDPLGATFAQVYFGSYNYVVWNDQFYEAPKIRGCGKSCGSPWGHSKGMVAWNDDGEGLVLQVSTPSWPASGSTANPRRGDGNTLGTVQDDDIEVSQHFFSLKLEGDDLVKVLAALANSSVVTDPTNPEIVRNGGPPEVQKLVKSLGKKVRRKTATVETLSSGVRLISKPSSLQVPPWQMVSALLGGVPLRVASWWAHPQIYSTTASSTIDCWDDSLGDPGPVEIATAGTWGSKVIGLTGGEGVHFNHAKVGVSTDASTPYSIFGDMNQQGALAPGYAYKTQKCSSSQNGRGGTFYVVADESLHTTITDLLAGASAPTEKKAGH